MANITAFQQELDRKALDVSITLVSQMKTIDPMFVGTTGLRVKSYSWLKSDGTVKVNFDASVIKLNNKVYKTGKNFVIVGYNPRSDLYSVKTVRVSSKGYISGKTYDDLFVSDLYWKIRNLTSY